MKKHGVEANDLNAHVAPDFKRLQRPRNLHFSPEGSEYLARKVAATIESALSR